MPLRFAPDPHDAPVFVLSLHRSGGTLLARLLNCHPSLVIWGEHAGLLNKLAEADMLLQAHAERLNGRKARDLRRHAARRPAPQLGFDPWLSPFNEQEYLDASRALVGRLFTAGLGPDQRWGFKEIRYHAPALTGFLRRLFPRGQFVLLDRDPVEVCVSGMLVSWGLERLVGEHVGQRQALFEQAVADCLYAIEAVRSNLRRARPALEKQGVALRYEDLTAAPAQEMARVLGFLGLRLDAATEQRMRQTAAAVAGATEKAPPVSAEALGFLTEPQIRQTAARLQPGIAARIDAEGIDLVRLRRRQTEGGFCWLIGDHAVTAGVPSTMF